MPGWLGPSQETQRSASRMLVGADVRVAGARDAELGVPGSPPALKFPHGVPTLKIEKCSRWPIESYWLIAPAW